MSGHLARSRGREPVEGIVCVVPRDAMIFLDRLAATPLLQWHALAMASPATVGSECQCALDRALARSASPFTIWQVRDHLDTLMYRFSGADGCDVVRGSVERERIRATTERALLAATCRLALSDADFCQLTGAFAVMTR